MDRPDKAMAIMSTMVQIAEAQRGVLICSIQDSIGDIAELHRKREPVPQELLLSLASKASGLMAVSVSHDMLRQVMEGLNR